MRVSETERLRRWRLVLGGGDADGTGAALDGDDVRIDAALGAVYDESGSPARMAGEAGRRTRGRTTGRAGALGRSAPRVARWLGDIRRYFPSPVVQVLQRDAIERLDLRRLLLEPEMLEAVEPDLHLVTLLVELNRLLPDETRATARTVVARVLTDLEQRLADRTRQAVDGALARANRSRRPRPGDIDWPHTVHANLRHWLPEHRTRRPREADRLRPPPAQPRPRRDHRHRPVGLDGRQRGVRLAVRSRARPAPGAAHPPRRVRHLGHRSHAAPARSGRCAVRRAARRRHRHRPGARLLPAARDPAPRHRARVDQRPVRGRQRRPVPGAHRRARAGRRDRAVPARAQRRRCPGARPCRRRRPGRPRRQRHGVHARRVPGRPRRCARSGDSSSRRRRDAHVRSRLSQVF